MLDSAFEFYYLIHLHSFDGAKERSKKTPAASKNLRILLPAQKIRTRPARVTLQPIKISTELAALRHREIFIALYQCR